MREAFFVAVVAACVVGQCTAQAEIERRSVAPIGSPTHVANNTAVCTSVISCVNYDGVDLVGLGSDRAALCYETELQFVCSLVDASSNTTGPVKVGQGTVLAADTSHRVCRSTDPTHVTCCHISTESTQFGCTAMVVGADGSFTTLPTVDVTPLPQSQLQVPMVGVSARTAFVCFDVDEQHLNCTSLTVDDAGGTLEALSASVNASNAQDRMLARLEENVALACWVPKFTYDPMCSVLEYTPGSSSSFTMSDPAVLAHFGPVSDYGETATNLFNALVVLDPATAVLCLDKGDVETVCLLVAVDAAAPSISALAPLTVVASDTRERYLVALDADTAVSCVVREASTFFGIHCTVLAVAANRTSWEVRGTWDAPTQVATSAPLVSFHNGDSAVVCFEDELNREVVTCARLTAEGGASGGLVGGPLVSIFDLDTMSRKLVRLADDRVLACFVHDDTANAWCSTLELVVVSPTPTPSPTASQSPTPSQTASSSPTPSRTASPSPTPSQTASSSPTPSRTASPSATPSQTASSSPTASQTASSSPTPSKTASPSPTTTPSPSATASASQTPTTSPTASQTGSASPSPSTTPSVTPSPSTTPSGLPAHAVTGSVALTGASSSTLSQPGALAALSQAIADLSGDSVDADDVVITSVQEEGDEADGSKQAGSALVVVVRFYVVTASADATATIARALSSASPQDIATAINKELLANAVPATVGVDSSGVTTHEHDASGDGDGGSDGGSDDNAGVIAGSVVGAAVAAGLVVVGVVFLRKRSTNSRAGKSTERPEPVAKHAV